MSGFKRYNEEFKQSCIALVKMDIEIKTYVKIILEGVFLWEKTENMTKPSKK